MARGECEGVERVGGERVGSSYQVLDRARDADGDVEVGRDDLACLADLYVGGRWEG